MFMFAWKGVLPLKCVSNISYRCLHVDSDQQKKKKKKNFLGMEIQAQTLTGFVMLIYSNFSRCKQMADISVRP